MFRRKSDIFLCCAVVNILLVALLFAHACVERKKALPLLHHRIALVEDLRLTDLSLFTEARYTRHPSMADVHTAFQEHPLSLEHFPSGTLLAPPQHIKRNDLD